MNEWVAMSLLAALLLLVALHYLRRSVGTLRRTTAAFEMLPDERRFLRRQAWRRLINSVLMIALAALLIGAYASGLNARVDEVNEQREAAAVDGKKPPLTDEQRQLRREFGWYWIAVLSLLGVVVMLAGVDLIATRRYALTQLRQIQTDRRAMLQRQLARWREERNGEAPE